MSLLRDVSELYWSRQVLAAQIVIDVLEKWYKRLKFNTFEGCLPRVTDEEEYDRLLAKADKVIEEIDIYFGEELTLRWSHWSKEGVTQPPNFKRLKPIYRVAMYQEIVEAIRKGDELIAEAEEVIREWCNLV